MMDRGRGVLGCRQLIICWAGEWRIVGLHLSVSHFGTFRQVRANKTVGRVEKMGHSDPKCFKLEHRLSWNELGLLFF